MLVFAPGLFLSLLAMISSVAGGVVRGAARDVLGADAESIVKRSNEPALAVSEPPTATPVPGALFRGNVHQKLGW